MRSSTVIVSSFLSSLIREKESGEKVSELCSICFKKEKVVLMYLVYETETVFREIKVN